MLETSELWIIVLVGLAVTGALVRWVIFKSSGKEIDPGDSNLLGSLRTKVAKALLEGNRIVQLEKAQGRDAVREEISNQLLQFVKDTDIFTKDEKELLTALDTSYLVRLIENELVRRGVLKPE